MTSNLLRGARRRRLPRPGVLGRGRGRGGDAGQPALRGRLRRAAGGRDPAQHGGLRAGGGVPDARRGDRPAPARGPGAAPRS